MPLKVALGEKNIRCDCEIWKAFFFFLKARINYILLGQMGRLETCHEINDYQAIWKNQQEKEIGHENTVKGKKNSTKRSSGMGMKILRIQ